MKLKPLQQLLEIEMDRKEFLLHMGGAILAIFGVSSFVRALTLPREQNTASSNRTGYGNSTYGR